MSIDKEKARELLKHCAAESYCSHFKATYSCKGCNEKEALEMGREALNTELNGMPGLFIPGITKEKFQNASLKAISLLLTVGGLYDVTLGADQSDDGWLTELDFDSWKQGYEQGKLWTQADIENSRGKCQTCKRNSDYVDHGTRCPIEEHYVLPQDGYCHLYEPFERKTDE